MMMNFLMKPYKKLQQRKVWLHLLDLFQILKRYHKHFVIFLDDKNIKGSIKWIMKKIEKIMNVGIEHALADNSILKELESFRSILLLSS